MNYLLQTKNLTKKYQNHLSVNNLCLNIEKGDIYGFIGKNGAGKTTTLKMILGLIPPTKGTISFLDKEIKSGDVSYLKNIGSIIEYPAFYENLTAYENLKIHTNYIGINNKKIIDETLEKVDLLNSTNKKVKNFSLGMKQRLGIARAILHKPKLLILDEPTNGLDPMGIKDLREFILRLSSEDNLTFIISSHILSELELVINKLGIIDNGSLLRETTIEDVNNSFTNYADIKINNTKKAQIILRNSFNLKSSIIENNFIRINLKNNNIKTNDISRVLINNNLDLFELIIHKENLEEYFFNITGDLKHD